MKGIFFRTFKDKLTSFFWGSMPCGFGGCKKHSSYVFPFWEWMDDVTSETSETWWISNVTVESLEVCNIDVRFEIGEACQK